MPEEDSNLFVKFHDPVSLRKTILETSKDILVHLQNFERFKAARNEKERMMNKLRNQINEVNQLFNVLKKEMPRTAEVKIKPVRRTESATKPSELESIEDQLADIESALSNLG